MLFRACYDEYAFVANAINKIQTRLPFESMLETSIYFYNDERQTKRPNSYLNNWSESNKWSPFTDPVSAILFQQDPNIAALLLHHEQILLQNADLFFRTTPKQDSIHILVQLFEEKFAKVCKPEPSFKFGLRPIDCPFFGKFSSRKLWALWIVNRHHWTVYIEEYLFHASILSNPSRCTSSIFDIVQKTST